MNAKANSAFEGPFGVGGARQTAAWAARLAAQLNR